MLCKGSTLYVSGTVCGHEHIVDVGYAFRAESPSPAASAAGGQGVHGLKMCAL